MIKAIWIAIALLISSSAVSLAQEDIAPFGLKWMVGTTDIEALGVTLAPVDLADFGKSFVATNLPKGLSDMETAILSFGYDDHLWRVAAIGNEFKDDKYGANGKARYEQLASSLRKSYDLADTEQRASTDSYYGAADKFAYSLSENEAWWYSTYKSSSAHIELSLDSNYEDTYWRLIYSHDAGEAAFVSSKSDSELDAL